MSTERPRSSSWRSPKLEPSVRSPSVTRASTPQSTRSSRWPAKLNPFQSVSRSCSIFVEPDEVAQGDGKLGLVGATEGIHPERVLETCDDDREAERVEPGVEEHEIIGQRRQRLLVL